MPLRLLIALFKQFLFSRQLHKLRPATPLHYMI
jgi:hypothetical protein